MSEVYLEYVEEFSIEIADFCPISPTCKMPLPETMPKRNNGVINIQNNDEWCFGWSILGALHPVKVHPERNPHLLYGKYIDERNMLDIPIPVPVSTPVYKKFEENNPEISLYISERRGSEFKEINLLVILEEEIHNIEANPRSHYCIIKDIHIIISKTALYAFGIKTCMWKIKVHRTSRLCDINAFREQAALDNSNVHSFISEGLALVEEGTSSNEEIELNKWFYELSKIILQSLTLM
nr:10545_t:CDS:2 [Entrophospora candida]